MNSESVVGIEKPCIWYEYGDGISTNNAGNQRIEIDSDNMRDVLIDKYPKDKIVKKIVLFNKIRKKKGLTKYLMYAIFFPKLYYYKLASKKLYKQLKYDVCIDDMYKMIKEEDYEGTVCNI